MSLPALEHVEKDGFRLRGLGMSRIDAFSDVVFGFALTLLVVSLDAPKTYAQLHASLRGFVPFAIGFVILMRIWRSHYQFFRRFGTHDLGTIRINSALLFVVLLYVYPLRFLLAVVSFGAAPPSDASGHNLMQLIVLYGFGIAAINLLLAALYWNGLRQRRELGLSRLEELLTRGYIADLLVVAVTGLLSSLTAWLLPEEHAGYGGLVYLSIPIIRPIMARMARKRVANFEALEKLTATPHPRPAEPAPTP